MDRARFQQIFSAFESKRILVIGDLILDEFVWGRVSRISPEAPVPVVEVDRETYYPGGAANVARNLREFSRNIAVMGLVGTDSAAEHLKKLLAEEGMNLDCVQQDPTYRTIVKTRIIAKHQQVVRVDREKKARLTQPQMERALAQLDALLSQLDAIIIEDYGKGLVQQEFADRISELARREAKLLAVDPNPNNILNWQGVSVMKPNRPEAFAAAGVPLAEPTEPIERDPRLRKASSTALARAKHSDTRLQKDNS